MSLLLSFLLIAAGCGSTRSASTETVHMPVIRLPGGGEVVKLLVPVTIEGHQYAFVVDSGSGRTVIDLNTANALGLPTAGPPVTAYSLGCALNTQIRQVRSWSFAGHEMPPLQVAVQAIDVGLPQVDGLPVVGLLGSDVLSKFGSIHLDFVSQTMTLGGVPPANAPSAPLSVLTTSKGAVMPEASLSVSGSRDPVNVLVDIGSARTYLASPAASTLGLTPMGPAIKLGTLACTVSAQLAMASGAKLGSVPIPLDGVLVGPSELTTHDPRAGAGLLGDDVLGTAASVWLDFAGHKLALQPGEGT